MSKFEVGNKVKVRKDLNEIYPRPKYGVNRSMIKYAGTIVTIKEVFEEGGYHIQEDDGEYNWSEAMLESKNEFIKGDYKMGNFRTNGMVELWASKRQDTIIKEANEEKETVLSEDTNYFQFKEAVSAVNVICKTNFESEKDVNTDDIIRLVGLDLCKDIYTKDTMTKLDAISDKYEQKKNTICEDVKILEALLSACETYEQEMSILQTRGIVDSKFVMEFEA